MGCQAVVVLERDEMVRETLVEVLSVAGYTAYGAKDIAETRTVLAQVPHPCLILADLLTTEMNGADLLQTRRQDDTLIQIPIAVMSSVAVEPDEEQTLHARGADAYLKKPFDIDLFLRTVEYYCNAL